MICNYQYEYWYSNIITNIRGTAWVTSLNTNILSAVVRSSFSRQVNLFPSLSVVIFMNITAFCCEIHWDSHINTVYLTLLGTILCTITNTCSKKFVVRMVGNIINSLKERNYIISYVTLPHYKLRYGISWVEFVLWSSSVDATCDPFLMKISWRTSAFDF